MLNNYLTIRDSYGCHGNKIKQCFRPEFLQCMLTIRDSYSTRICPSILHLMYTMAVMETKLNNVFYLNLHNGWIWCLTWLPWKQIKQNAFDLNLHNVGKTRNIYRIWLLITIIIILYRINQIYFQWIKKKHKF